MTPVVFVHGNPENDAVWDRLAAALARRRTDRADPALAAGLRRSGAGGLRGHARGLPRLAGRRARADRRARRPRRPRPRRAARHQPRRRAARARPQLGHRHDRQPASRLRLARARADLADAGRRRAVHDRAARRRTGGRAPRPSSHGGWTPPTAARVATAFDETMAACILRFYRAPQLTGFEAAAARPGLAFLATDDKVVGTDAQRREAAAMAGAQVVELEGAGHWWMTAARRVSSGRRGVSSPSGASARSVQATTSSRTASSVERLRARTRTGARSRAAGRRSRPPGPRARRPRGSSRRADPLRPPARCPARKRSSRSSNTGRSSGSSPPMAAIHRRRKARASCGREVSESEVAAGHRDHALAPRHAPGSGEKRDWTVSATAAISAWRVPNWWLTMPRE